MCCRLAPLFLTLDDLEPSYI